MEKKYVATGAVTVLLTILGGIGYAVYEVGPWAVDNVPKFIDLIKPAEAKTSQSERSCKKWYLTTYYKAENQEEKDHLVTWEACLKGDVNPSGEVKDSTQNTGLAQGYERSGTFTLSYASSDPKRPGFGYYALRPVNPIPRVPSDPVTYAGIIMTHACDPGADEGSMCAGPVLICPAVMSQRPEPEPDLKAQFFKKPCYEPDAIWPKTPEG